MDSSLAILIAGTALFAGAAAYPMLRRDLGRRRAGLACLAAAAAVAATFLLMLGLAAIALPATVAVAALFSGAVAYLVLRRDLGRRRAAPAAAGAALVVAACFLFVVYLAVIAFVAAAGAYLLLRTRLRIGPALILMGSTLSGLLAAAGVAFWAALASM
jgi:hypothetical protein